MNEQEQSIVDFITMKADEYVGAAQGGYNGIGQIIAMEATYTILRKLDRLDLWETGTAAGIEMVGKTFAHDVQENLYDCAARWSLGQERSEG